MVVAFRMGSLRGVNNIARIATRFPKSVMDAKDEFGMSLQRRVKRNITAKRLISTRNLHKRSRWDRKKSQFVMPAYGAELETERPKTVVVRPHSRLWNWVFLKRNIGMHHATTRKFPALERKVRSKQPIHLRRYDVFNGPFANTISDLPLILKRHAKTVVNTKGRLT